jgi:hypothetical protein
VPPPSSAELSLLQQLSQRLDEQSALDDLFVPINTIKKDEEPQHLSLWQVCAWGPTIHQTAVGAAGTPLHPSLPWPCVRLVRKTQAPRPTLKGKRDFVDMPDMNMSLEEEQSVSIPSVRLQLEQVSCFCLNACACYVKVSSGSAPRFGCQHPASSSASRHFLLCRSYGYTYCTSRAIQVTIQLQLICCFQSC